MSGTSSTDSTLHDVPSGAVVVGVDGTAASSPAVTWAAEHAAVEGRPLVVLHAVDDTAVEATAWAGVTWVLPTPLDRLTARGREVVQEAADVARGRHPGLEVIAVAAPGGGRRLLVDLSRDAAMLVLGSRGRGPVGSALLGSVGAHVSRHSHCPVVVCRPDHRGRVHDGVVVLCDGTPTALPVVTRAIELAAGRGLPVTVLRCVPDASHEGAAMVSLEGDLAPLRARFPDVPVRSEVHAGEPDHVLATRPRPPHLVVVGRHPVDSALRHLGHVNATRVLERVESPVLVVPQAG